MPPHSPTTHELLPYAPPPPPRATRWQQRTAIPTKQQSTDWLDFAPELLSVFEKQHNKPECKQPKCTLSTTEDQPTTTPLSANWRKRRRRQYVALCTKDTAMLQAVAKEPAYPGYRLVEAVLDSGAEESVAPPRLFLGPIAPSQMSQAGGSYRVANGQRVPNVGQQKVQFTLDDGQPANILFQIAEIERPLISASALAANGNSVVFNHKGGAIIHDKTGRRTELHKRGGIYVLHMWVREDPEPGFARQGGR